MRSKNQWNVPAASAAWHLSISQSSSKQLQTLSTHPNPSIRVNPPLEFGRAVPSIIEPWRAFSMTFHWFDGTCTGSSSCPSEAVPCCCTYGWGHIVKKNETNAKALPRARHSETMGARPQDQATSSDQKSVFFSGSKGLSDALPPGNSC